MKQLADTTVSRLDRRTFMSTASALSAASLLGVPLRVSAEPPPEVKRIRLSHFPAICLTPNYLAEELLRSEGFGQVEYVDGTTTGSSEGIGARRVDFEMLDAPTTPTTVAAARAETP